MSLRPSHCALPLACALLFALGCGDSSDAHADAGTKPTKRPFKIVLEHLDGALMSVTGTADDDVWAVGANTQDAKGALVLHYDGSSWQRLATGVEANLWWAHAFGKDNLL